MTSLDDGRTLDSVERGRTRLDLVEYAGPDGPSYEVRSGKSFRASSGGTAWSEALADLVTGRGGRSRLDVLLRGLGTGDCLRMLLADGAIHSVTVVEPERVVLRWSRRFLGNAALLDDPRVSLIAGTLVDAVQGVPGSYDGLLLDYSVSLVEANRDLTLTTLSRLTTRVRAAGAVGLLTPGQPGNLPRLLADAFGEMGLREVEALDRSGARYDASLYFRDREAAARGEEDNEE